MEAKNLQILIANSSLASNLRIKIQLEKLGYTSITTTDNVFRLRYFINKIKPNLIIMDTELLNSSIDNCLYESEIPILFITFYGIEERLFDLVNRKHTVGYLEKPIDIFSLYSCIQWIVKSYQNSKLQEKK